MPSTNPVPRTSDAPPSTVTSTSASASASSGPSQSESVVTSPRYVPGQKRSRELEVLAVGYPRTGTASMKLALELLGYTHCAHGFDIMDNQEYVRRFEQAVDRQGTPQAFTRADWDELLGHCAAVTDMPCAMFWRELAEAYPEAKIVLVQRDEQAWLKSFTKGVIEPMFTWTGSLTRALVEPMLGSRTGPFALKVLDYALRKGRPSSKRSGTAMTESEMKDAALPVYRAHYASIRAAIPASRLLEYRLGSGWAPLCEFLGRPAPDAQFPWVNEADELLKKIEAFKAAKGAELQQQLSRFSSSPAFLFAVSGLVVAAAAVVLYR